MWTYFFNFFKVKYFPYMEQIQLFLLYINIPTTNQKMFVLAAVLLVLCASKNVNNSNTTPCLAFHQGLCISCPYNYFLYEEKCYQSIQGCLNYTQNITGILNCALCDSSVTKSDGNGGCTLTVNTSEFTNSSYFQQICSNYGELIYQSMTLSEATANSFFKKVNSYMLNGDYKKFISKTAQPVQFVGIFQAEDVESFKILYTGNGGGLMLCLISINETNNAIKLGSFVQIQSSNIVDNCKQYDLKGKCIQCQARFHLQNSRCQTNIDNCVSYSQNICLECSGCIVSCCGMGDLSRIPFYGNYTNSSIKNLHPMSRSYLID